MSIIKNFQQTDKYLTCNCCGRCIKVNHEPQYKHFNGECYKIVCIWCIYQNYKTQYSRMIREKNLYNKNDIDKEKELQQFYAFMPCCKKYCKGALYQMRQVLRLNCCIHGLTCQELKKDFVQLDCHLTVGRKCYKQLANTNFNDQSFQTKNKRYVLEQLNKLSTQKCSYCQESYINFVIGKYIEINYRICQNCYQAQTSNQQLNIEQHLGQQKITIQSLTQHQANKRQQTSNTIKQNQIIKICQIKQNKEQNKSNLTVCCKCQQKFTITPNRILILTQYNKNTYCYFCLFLQFQSLKNKNKLNKISQQQYISQLIKFQQIFLYHCIICGFNFNQNDQKMYVFTLKSQQMDLQACYCATCDKYLNSDTTAFKNLIDLKDILIKRNLWKNTINTKMTVSMYRTLIQTKLHKLLTYKSKLIKSKQSNPVINLSKDPLVHQQIQKDPQVYELKQSKKQQITKHKQFKNISYIWIDVNEQFGDKENEDRNKTVQAIKTDDNQLVQDQFVDIHYIEEQINIQTLTNPFKLTPKQKSQRQELVVDQMQDKKDQMQVQEDEMQKQEDEKQVQEDEMQQFEDIEYSDCHEYFYCDKKPDRIEYSNSQQSRHKLNQNKQQYISNIYTNQQEESLIQNQSSIKQTNFNISQQKRTPFSSRQYFNNQTSTLIKTQKQQNNQKDQQTQQFGQYQTPIQHIQYQSITTTQKDHTHPQMKNNDPQLLSTHPQMILTRPQLIQNKLQWQTNKFNFDLHLKNKIIDFTLQQSQQQLQQKLQQKPLHLTHTHFLINNYQSIKLSIENIQQLNQFLVSSQFNNTQSQNIQPNQNKTINKRSHKSTVFSAKQQYCSNCKQLDFFLSLGSLCQLCFIKYLMGQKIQLNKQNNQQGLIIYNQINRKTIKRSHVNLKQFKQKDSSLSQRNKY